MSWNGDFYNYLFAKCSLTFVYIKECNLMTMNNVEKGVYTALIALGVGLVYRDRKQLWEWLSSEPEPEYVPDGIEAELYMDSEPEKYPDFHMQWDE